MAPCLARFSCCISLQLNLDSLQGNTVVEAGLRTQRANLGLSVDFEQVGCVTCLNGSELQLEPLTEHAKLLLALLLQLTQLLSYPFVCS